ncbi:MAG: PAS domain-containing sensor histidine kinase, partial [Rectinemataceae bacterium]|nr:PAS domain-containing sensor histidine kinase [Rectinemataceae bacterium]
RQNLDEIVTSQRLLKESEEKYRTVFENTGTAMVVIEENTIISLANTVFANLCGFSKDDIEGKKSWTEFVVKEDRERMLALHRLRRQNQEEALTHYEFRFVTKSGDIRHIFLTIDVIPGTKKSVASLMDITERKRMEDALALASQKLNLLSGITRHDILNQLTALKGYLELSRENVNDPVLSDFISKEERIAGIIVDQITFTRDYQDLGVNAPAWQNVITVVGKAVKDLPLRDVRVDVDRTDPEVFADPLLERVFYNLVDNALMHGGEQMTGIRISSHEQDTGLVITCEDDGVGISEGDKKHLFERGFGRHTGLGLFLSREILSITGITITETGEPGKGARFEIAVPKEMYRFSGQE